MRLESGTPNVPAIIGLDAAQDWFAQTGIENVQAHCAALIEQLWTGLAAIAGVSLIGPPPSPERGFVVSFNVKDADALVVSQILAENYGVSSRAGLHCAPTAHRYFAFRVWGIPRCRWSDCPRILGRSLPGFKIRILDARRKTCS